MAFVFENVGIPSGKPYVNIGTEKSCFFVPMSLYLCHQLQKHPLLYYAVEESLECSKLGYYSSGIIAFSQILQLLKEKVPMARHKVAHEILKGRPSKGDFDDIRQQVKQAVWEIYERERRGKDDPEVYWQKVLAMWKRVIGRLNRSQSSMRDGIERA